MLSQLVSASESFVLLCFPKHSSHEALSLTDLPPGLSEHFEWEDDYCDVDTVYQQLLTQVKPYRKYPEERGEDRDDRICQAMDHMIDLTYDRTVTEPTGQSRHPLLRSKS